MRGGVAKREAIGSNPSSSADKFGRQSPGHPLGVAKAAALLIYRQSKCTVMASYEDRARNPAQGMPAAVILNQGERITAASFRLFGKITFDQRRARWVAGKACSRWGTAGSNEHAVSTTAERYALQL
jgi:hypothetical protein